MTVLVTGATGFVGSHLTESLVGAGHQVRVLVRPTSRSEFLKTLDLEILTGDLTDAAAVEKAVRGCRLVYHAAALTGRKKIPKRLYDAVNLQGTEQVARAALKAQVERLVYVSTCSIYGTIKNPPVNEDTPPNPNSWYRSTKFSGEQAVRKLHREHGLPVVIARISSVLGPRSTSWLGLFQAIAEKRFGIIGSGNNRLHLGYVTDVVAGIRRCGETAGIEGETFLLSGPDPIRLHRLVELIAQELGVTSPTGGPAVFPFRVYHELAWLTFRHLKFEWPHSHRYELFFSDMVFDGSKARRVLGYHPTVSPEEIIRRMVGWFRQEGYL